MPGCSNWANFDDRGQRLDLHQNNGSYRGGNRRGGMEHDAKRTMIRVGIDRVDVGYLDDREERQESQAYHHECDESPWPRVAITTHPCMKSGQA
jgi:hypothetical protein